MRDAEHVKNGAERHPEAPEDHLSVVTLELYAALKGLAAPVELLVEALDFEAPRDTIKP